MRSFLVLLFALPSLAALGADPLAPDAGVPAAGSQVGTQATPAEALAIRQTFTDYQAALASKAGKKAASLVDGETLRYYATAQKLALEANKETAQKLPLIDKLMVLRMRAEFPAEKLAAYSPQELIAVGVERGWVGSTAENALGEIFIRGDHARGQALVQGQPVPLYHEFRREGGAWKLSLVALTRAVGPVMSEAARRLELTEDEFLLFMLEQGLPKKPGPEIWDAPRPSGKSKKKK